MQDSNNRNGAEDDRRFYNSTPWLRLRQVQLDASPLCQHCLQMGRTTTAEHVDHMVARKARPDRALDLDNLQSLCRSCHSRKTMREQDAGRRVIISGPPGSSQAWVEKHAPDGSIVYDYDHILAAIVTGEPPDDRRPRDLIPMMEAIRRGIIDWLESYTTTRDLFIIMANTARAKTIAKQIGAESVVLRHRGQKPKNA